MIDWIGPSIGAAVVLIAGGLSWTLNSTRATEGTAKGVSALGRSIDGVRADHSRRLDTHIDYISRREFDEKMVSAMATINANYSSIKDQHQRSASDSRALVGIRGV